MAKVGYLIVELPLATGAIAWTLFAGQAGDSAPFLKAAIRGR
jgi:hypothetical protein